MPKVYEFVAHVRDDRSGPAGDGSFTFRYYEKEDAEREAQGKEYYGQPVQVIESNVPHRIFDRWEREGKILKVEHKS